MKKNKKSNFTNIILEHIKNNSKEYVLLLLFFLIGIVIGTFFVNNTSLDQKQVIANYINTFIKSSKESEFINYGKFLNDSLIKNISFAAILWLIGLTVTLVPLIYGIISFRGFCLGYTISALIGTLGVKDGILFSGISLILQNMIFIPAIFEIAISGIRLHKKVIKSSETDMRKKVNNSKNIKLEVIRHSCFTLIMMGIIILSSLVETYISTNFTNVLIKNI